MQRVIIVKSTFTINSAAGPEKINFYKEQAADLIQPLLIPGVPLPPSKWVRLFLLFFGGIYIVSFYKFVREEIHFLRCEDCKADLSIWGSLINISFLTVVFFLLLKRKRRGWILLAAGSMSTVPIGLFQFYLSYKYRALWPHYLDINAFLFILIFQIALLYFLWKAAIADFFGVDEKTKRATVWTGLVIGLVYVGLVQ